VFDLVDEALDQMALFDTRPHEGGSPSPIVQIQWQYVLAPKSCDEHFINYHTVAPSGIQGYKNWALPGFVDSKI
jgi:hypothetical protein